MTGTRRGRLSLKTQRFPLRVSSRRCLKARWSSAFESLKFRADTVSDRPRFISFIAISIRGSQTGGLRVRFAFFLPDATLRRTATLRLEEGFRRVEGRRLAEPLTRRVVGLRRGRGVVLRVFFRGFERLGLVMRSGLVPHQEVAAHSRAMGSRLAKGVNRTDYADRGLFRLFRLFRLFQLTDFATSLPMTFTMLAVLYPGTSSFRLAGPRR